jgi:hypothetical protein
MKATRAVFRQRAEAVMKLRLLGAEFHDVRQYAQEDDPESGRPWLGENGKVISERQLWRYCRAADKLLDKTLEKNKQNLLNRHIGMRRALYARAMESGDWRAALAVADSEARLLALFPDRPAREAAAVQVNVWAPALERLTDEELHHMARLAERVNQLNHENGSPSDGAHADHGPGPAAAGDDLARAVPPRLPALCGPDVDPVRDGGRPVRELDSV